MIQKIILTVFIFFIFIFGLRLLKKIRIYGSQKKTNNKNDENIVDLEKDPKTNEYRPKK